MPGMGGEEAIRHIIGLGLEAKVLVLTVHDEDDFLIPTLDAGAEGFLDKSVADTDLLGSLPNQISLREGSSALLGAADHSRVSPVVQRAGWHRKQIPDLDGLRDRYPPRIALPARSGPLTGSPVGPPGVVQIEPGMVLSEPMVEDRTLVGESAHGGSISATTAPIQSPHAEHHGAAWIRQAAAGISRRRLDLRGP